MTTNACAVIDLVRYREERGLPKLARPALFDASALPKAAVAMASQAPSPEMAEALSMLGRELRNAELRLIDLAATIDELYAQVDDMARR
ncbi:hypothetical protein [Caldimonas tepidiphila]|uniref:hypothetical protein n=1 Tax=Caldimonas tepidiphila TaxID=2315841 RepID=UPI000E5B33BB|nr:hypothetical protein [Caldimonas tepidiphila]